MSEQGRRQAARQRAGDERSREENEQSEQGRRQAARQRAGDERSREENEQSEQGRRQAARQRAGDERSREENEQSEQGRRQAARQRACDELAIDRVAQLLRRRIGLRPDPALRGRVRRAVRDETARRAISPAGYVELLAAGGEALQELLNRVTVQETSFFRHPQHFAVLAADILPALRAPVTIWSAGCANGQEAYSLAMVLDEQGVDGHVIATDVSTAALRHAEAAVYSARELAGLSPERRSAFTERLGSGRRIAERIRSRVSLRRHNMLDEPPADVRGCQVVFCRNVLIYLSPAHVRAFLDRLGDALPADLCLFLGAAESVWQVSDRFLMQAAGGTFLYRPAVQPDPVQLDPLRPDPLRPDPVRPDPVRPVPVRPDAPAAEPSTGAAAATGRAAMAAGDPAGAVIAFRRWVYLAPADPIPLLHLGMALEATGDGRAARRAYAAALGALSDVHPAERSELEGLEGYATEELVRLLEAKQQELV